MSFVINLRHQTQVTRLHLVTRQEWYQSPEVKFCAITETKPYTEYKTITKQEQDIEEDEEEEEGMKFRRTEQVDSILLPTDPLAKLILGFTEEAVNRVETYDEDERLHVVFMIVEAMRRSGVNHEVIIGFNHQTQKFWWKVAGGTMRQRQHEKSERIVNYYADKILGHIKHRRNYVAKVSHLSYSDGVVVIKDFDQNLLANVAHVSLLEKSPFEKVMSASTVARFLAETLYFPATYQTHESWALQQVPPGLVIEERLTIPKAPGWESTADNEPAMEFKTFTIWGKPYVTYWCQFGNMHGIIFPNGTARPLIDEVMAEYERPLPAWLDFDRILAISSELGAHKDMFRTDIFVGVPAGGSRKLNQLQYVVSEVEIFSTYTLGDLAQPAGKLWLQGYIDANYVAIPNHEVVQEKVRRPPAVVASL